MKQIFPLILVFLLLIPILGFSQLSIEEHLGMENISNPKVFDSKILFTKRAKVSWNGKATSSIIISDLNGENQVNLTNNEYVYNPKWSPNGEYVSFISYRNNLQQVYIVPRSGGEPIMVSDAQNYLSNHTWLSKKTIAYVDDEPGDSLIVSKEKENGGGYIAGTEFYTNAIWTYDIDSGTRNKITKGDNRIINFDVIKDGKRLAILAAKNYDAFEAIASL